MAKDGFDIVTDVMNLINVPSILALLEGGQIDPSVKTTSSSVKGIVVSSLGITNAAEQVGNGNINCYAPPIISTIDDKSVLLPDQSALSTLAKAISPLVDGYRGSNFECWITTMPTVMQDTEGGYFANLQFEYRSSQYNLKNI